MPENEAFRFIQQNQKAEAGNGQERNSKMRDLPPLVTLTGPTAVGKTDLSIRLAKALNGEIISADSAQVYRGLDIGSAKITPEEMKGVPHHLIDILDPAEDFDVTIFQHLAKEAIAGIYERGRIPIVVGGTGFYIQALLRDVHFTEASDDPAYQKELEILAAEKGPAVLHDMLREVDPEYAAQLPPENVKRCIRALEFHHLTGQKLSEHNEEERHRPNAYNVAYFVLNDDRDKLYARIDERVDLMIRAGLVSEVQALLNSGLTPDKNSMQAIGYKEIIAHFTGACTLEEAIYNINLNSRHFAKRQLTWFRREGDVIWVNKPDFDYDEDRILAYLVDTAKNFIKSLN